MARGLAVSLVESIQAAGLKMPKLQISSVGGLSFAAAFDGIPTTIMVNEASAGVDFDPDLAVTKALVEYLERMAFLDGIDNEDPICERLHSDGIAAFPLSNPEARFLARRNAYSEAVERFVWASWWDNKNIGHESIDLTQTDFLNEKKIADTMKKFENILPISATTMVEPLFDDPDHSLIILFSKIKGYGYISGGAAGLKTNRRETFIRALSELIRHGIAISRFINLKVDAATFYERRLLFFGLGHGNHLVEDRLNIKSREVLRLPELAIDDEIKSVKTDGLIATHRCLFVEQPPFVDGILERLCL